MPFNPSKRSQPVAVSQSPAPAPAPTPARASPPVSGAAVHTGSTPSYSLPSSPASSSTPYDRSHSRSSSNFFDRNGNTPASSASSTFSPDCVSYRESKRHGRLESGGIAFEAVTPVKRIGSIVRKPRSRQTTVTEVSFDPPRQRSQSHLTQSSFLLQPPPSPRLARNAATANRPRIIRRASSMDNIIANSASSTSPFLRPKSPRSKLTARVFYKALEGDTERQGSPFGPKSIGTPHAGLKSVQRSPASSRRSSSNIPMQAEQDASVIYTTAAINKLRMKSANANRERRWPTSPPLMSGQRSNQVSALPPTSLLNQLAAPDQASTLRLSMLTGASETNRRVLDNIDTSDDLTITLRGDKAAVQGLEVMLVCVAEGDETVWELRVKRSTPVKAASRHNEHSTGSSLSSPRSSPPTNSRATTPFTAIYTPPCEDLDMYRADYFSAPVPRDSLPSKQHTTINLPSALSPFLPSQRSATVPLAQLPAAKPIAPAASAYSESHLVRGHARASTSSEQHRFHSGIQAMSCPVTPRRTRFGTACGEGIENSDSLFDYEGDGGSAKGFSSLYSGLAEAYRSAHQDTEDEFELEKEAALDGSSSPVSGAVPSGMVGSSFPSSPTTSLTSPNRSPEHRYALYLPSPTVPLSPSTSSSGAAGDLATPREELPENDWNGYSSCIAGSYAALHGFGSPKTPSALGRNQHPTKAHAFCSPGPFPTSPSLHDASPTISPATTLLQRRRGDGKAPSFRLGLPAQLFPGQSRDATSRVLPLQPLRFDEDYHYMAGDIPHDALARLGDSRGSIGSISLKGRQGWSETETEPEGSSDDDDSCEADSAEHSGLSSCTSAALQLFEQSSIAGHA